jgi:cell division protease FtsH
MTLSDDRGPTFLGVKVPEARTYSDQTALVVDREVQALVLEAQERARQIVQRHREKLEVLAARLLATEVVEEEEMVRLWGPKVERPGGLEGRGHVEAPPEHPNRPLSEGVEGPEVAGWQAPQAAEGILPSGKG